ncbi:MAG TPA: Gfo/Idh/MocA family oxidoreductase [Acidimicrobiales bacterium]|nr:Gfo/Idh/MocA family oxidoreductase [Acidimicrobiales bacterium]
MQTAKAGKKSVGIGVLGCGTIGPLHAAAAEGLGGAHLVAVADMVPERAAKLAAHHGVRACAGIQELLALPGVDLVCVCTPSGTHAELGVQVAEAGRHVVVEKPIDTNLDAAGRLARSCAGAGVELSVIFQHRFDAGVSRLRDALAKGEIGPVAMVEGRAWWYRPQSYYDADAWRGTYAMDGGALMNQGVHLVDLMLHLFGPAREVGARVTTAAHAMEAEDSAVVHMQMASGALGVLSVSTATFPGVAETLTVSGPRAGVSLQAGQVSSWKVAGGDRTEARGEAAFSAALGSKNLAVDAHRSQLQDVVDAVRSGGRPAVGAKDGWDALALVLAAYGSARTGRVAVPAPFPSGFGS